jgi:hypothetical protein
VTGSQINAPILDLAYWPIGTDIADIEFTRWLIIAINFNDHLCQLKINLYFGIITGRDSRR